MKRRKEILAYAFSCNKTAVELLKCVVPVSTSGGKSKLLLPKPIECPESYLKVIEEDFIGEGPQYQ